MKAMKQVAGKIKGDARPVSANSRPSRSSAPTSTPRPRRKLDRGARIVELFKQQQYNPLPVELQVATLWAMQNNYFDDVPVDRVKEFQTKLQDYLTTRKEAVLAGLRDKPEINDANAAALKEAVAEFKQGWR